jgi:hypothetical protein
MRYVTPRDGGREQTWLVPNRTARICTPCGEVEAEFLANPSSDAVPKFNLMLGRALANAVDQPGSPIMDIARADAADSIAEILGVRLDALERGYIDPPISEWPSKARALLGLATGRSWDRWMSTLKSLESAHRSPEEHAALERYRREAQREGMLPNRSRIPLDELERTHRHVHDAKKIRENFRDEDAEYAEIVPWTWPTDMQEIGTCESVMYASDKWQKRRGDLIDYKHIAESSQRLFVRKNLLTEYEPPHRAMDLAGPWVKVDGPMPDSFAVLAEILAVQCRLYQKRGSQVVIPRGDEGLIQIDLPHAMLGAAVHPGTKQVFLVVYSGDTVHCLVNGDALNVEKDGIVG